MDEQQLDAAKGEVPAAGRVVVGVDGSAASIAALRWAAGVASATGWSIDAVSAWQQPITYGWDVGIEVIDWADDTHKALTATLDEAYGPDRPIGLRAIVVHGDPAHELITHAAGAPLLVVGNRGLGGFLGLLLGSVSSKCAAHARCPVLIVHPEDAAPLLPGPAG